MNRLYLGGFAALEGALAEEVGAAKERDALPGRRSWSVRRRWRPVCRARCRRLGGHANVRVVTVHRLAGELAAAGGLPAGRLLTAEAQAVWSSAWSPSRRGPAATSVRWPACPGWRAPSSLARRSAPGRGLRPMPIGVRCTAGSQTCGPLCPPTSPHCGRRGAPTGPASTGRLRCPQGRRRRGEGLLPSARRSWSTASTTCRRASASSRRAGRAMRPLSAFLPYPEAGREYAEPGRQFFAGLGLEHGRTAAAQAARPSCCPWATIKTRCWRWRGAYAPAGGRRALPPGRRGGAHRRAAQEIARGLRRSACRWRGACRRPAARRPAYSACWTRRFPLAGRPWAGPRSWTSRRPWRAAGGGPGGRGGPLDRGVPAGRRGRRRRLAAARRPPPLPRRQGRRPARPGEQTPRRRLSAGPRWPGSAGWRPSRAQPASSTASGRPSARCRSRRPGRRWRPRSRRWPWALRGGGRRPRAGASPSWAAAGSSKRVALADAVRVARDRLRRVSEPHGSSGGAAWPCSRPTRCAACGFSAVLFTGLCSGGFPSAVAHDPSAGHGSRELARRSGGAAGGGRRA